MNLADTQPRSLKNRRAVHHSLAALLVAVPLTASGCGGVEPPQQTAPRTVEVAPVMKRDVRVYREWIGTIDGHVNAQIQPRLEGHVIRQVYRDGDFVRRGDSLFEIDPRPFQADLDLAVRGVVRNEVALAKAPCDFETYLSPAWSASSQRDLDIAPSKERSLQEKVASARAAVEMARLNLSSTKIISPIDGVAGTARVHVGDIVSGETVMTTVSSVDPINVFFFVSGKEHVSLTKRPGRTDRGRGLSPQGKDIFELILPDGSLYPYRGSLSSNGRDLDLTTPTIMVGAVIPNPDHLLRPGQPVRVRAALEASQPTFLVPQRAVRETQGIHQLAVVRLDKTVDIRAVRMEERVGSLWVIDNVLNPGDRVIVSGFESINPGMVVEPMEANPESVSPAAMADEGC